MMALIIIRMLDVSVICILGLTKRRYVETVLKAIQQCKNEEVDIDVRWALNVLTWGKEICVSCERKSHQNLT